MNLSATTSSKKHPSETNVAAAQAVEAARTEEVESKIGDVAEVADVEVGENVEHREVPAVDEV